MLTGIGKQSAGNTAAGGKQPNTDPPNRTIPSSQCRLVDPRTGDYVLENGCIKYTSALNQNVLLPLFTNLDSSIVKGFGVKTDYSSVSARNINALKTEISKLIQPYISEGLMSVEVFTVLHSDFGVTVTLKYTDLTTKERFTLTAGR